LVNLPTRAILEEVLVLRPDNLYVIPTKIVFNYLVFNSLEIDLQHIEADGYQRYFGGSCLYFKSEFVINKFKYKLVFCICSDRPKRIGVMTLYRIGKIK
jgi:hypothetical protein